MFKFEKKLQVKANLARRKAAKAWLAVEAVNASDGVLGVLLNKGSYLYDVPINFGIFNPPPHPLLLHFLLIFTTKYTQPLQLHPLSGNPPSNC